MIRGGIIGKGTGYATLKLRVEPVALIWNKSHPQALEIRLT